jgi:hypothetical protein
MATVAIRVWRKTQRKLTAQQVEQVRALPWERGSLTRLAKEFGVAKSVLSEIRSGLRYKRPGLQQTYVARVTDGRQRYSLGSFLTPEAAQNAIDSFPRTNKWPRGSIYQAGTRYRARLSLGTYVTRREAEQALDRVLKLLAMEFLGAKLESTS